MRFHIKTIKTKRPFLFGSNEFERIIRITEDESADEALAMFEKTTLTWNTHVNFYKRKIAGGVSVGTRSKIYKFVDQGTRPHIIRPKKKRVLKFKANYKAKTRTKVIASYAGGASGKDVYTSKPVRHPGTDPRNFVLTISERIAKSHSRRVKEKIARLVR
jgi:hypothetical protein